MTSVPRQSAERIKTGGVAGAADWPVRLALIPALALAAALAGPAMADIRTAPQVSYLRAGLFCAPPEAGRREAPDTVSGWTHLPDQPIRIIVDSLVSPAALGQGFGVEFLLDSDDPVPLLYEVTHPPMPPTGATRQSWSPDGPALGGGALFFQFDEPEELVTGTWIFRALSGDEELLSVAFEVVPTQQAPHLTGLCAGTMLSALEPRLSR
jgi:hypothetical protein